MQIKYGLHLIKLVHNQTFPFAKLSSIIKDQIVTITGFEAVYQNMLKTNKVTETGNIKFRSDQFGQLVNLITNEKEATLGTEAYCNFIGHLNSIPLSTQDRFFQKCISLNQIDFVLNVYYHQRTLMYFPSSNTTQMLMNFVLDSDQEKLMKLLKSLKRNLLIKLDDDMMIEAFDKTSNTNNYQAVYQIYEILKCRKMYLPSPQLPKLSMALFHLNKEKDHKQQLTSFVNEIEKVNEEKGFDENDQHHVLMTQIIAYAALHQDERSIICLVKLINMGEKSKLSINTQFQDILATIIQEQVTRLQQQPEWIERLQQLVDQLKKIHNIDINVIDKVFKLQSEVPT